MIEKTYEDGILFHKKNKPVALPEAFAPLADTHTHFTCYDEIDPSVAIARAKAAGVELMVVPLDPTDKDLTVEELHNRSRNWIEAAHHEEDKLRSAHVEVPDSNLYENIHFLAGVHPYGYEAYSSSILDYMGKLLEHPSFVGVGEFGIDYNSGIDSELQKNIFREQLDFARSYNLPIELHIRNEKEDETSRAYHDVYEILKRDGAGDCPVIIHCFVMGPEIMRPFTDMGCYVAFGGASTFNSAPYIRDSIAECPAHLMLSETDAPFMAPVPLRGYECEPAMIAFIVDNIARVREEAGVCSREKTYMDLWENATNLFPAK